MATPSRDPVLPVPPPPLRIRPGNEAMARPQTPPQQWFTSPTQTPQGSPSKKQAPPGANSLSGLSDIFDKALKLTPVTVLSPSKAGRSQQSSPVLSPKGSNVPTNDDSLDGVDNSVLHKNSFPISGSPTRKSNKENAPPGSKQGKEVPYLQSSAAASRQEPYQPRERKAYEAPRGPTLEEIEKLQKPHVKRLANVTQLCTCIESHYIERSYI